MSPPRGLREPLAPMVKQSAVPSTASVALVMMDTRVPDSLAELASAPFISLKYNVSTLLFAYFLNLKCARNP